VRRHTSGSASGIVRRSAGLPGPKGAPGSSEYPAARLRHRGFVHGYRAPRPITAGPITRCETLGLTLADDLEHDTSGGTFITDSITRGARFGSGGRTSSAPGSGSTRSRGGSGRMALGSLQAGESEGRHAPSTGTRRNWMIWAGQVFGPRRQAAGARAVGKKLVRRAAILFHKRGQGRGAVRTGLPGMEWDR